MLPGPVKIFTTSNVPRLNYVADLILNEILGLSWEIITDKRRLGKSPVINYSDYAIPGSFKISPVSLLFEKDIRNQEITVSEWRDLPVFFQTPQDSDMPFDIFAATFYLVTRYEEYLDFIPDKHGRFTASSSLAFRNGFLRVPVVDLWAKELAKVLVRKYQTLSFKRNEFKSVLTIDIDEPFAYRGRNLIGNLGGFIHDITASTGQVSHRIGCLTGREKDPFEVYDYLTEKIKIYNSETKFFFPVGNRSDYEKNPSWKNEEYRKLIRGIADDFDIGLHPSFRASTDFLAASSELKRLNAIVARDILVSRFHFLKINIPVSYRNISLTGIQEDYSMGYPDEPGFRAGIGRPFHFFDVAEDKITALKIFPFQVMDITLTGYKKLDPDSAKEVVQELIGETRKAGGLFISIWHNTTLTDNPDCRGWRELFEFTLANQGT